MPTATVLYWEVLAFLPVMHDSFTSVVCTYRYVRLVCTINYYYIFNILYVLTLNMTKIIIALAGKKI